ncbi:hypothetical protein [Aquabacterium sp.]|uniref:hypothetical protein n=1 Tax=Aquabacterium sp. TaxID=1872578 RepID=UPI0019BB79BB|nr:hypothetical protein [Aquabacterium sp.]MBC7701130.1 hypothetical protein [Aquabacterium sp.]
MRPSLTVLMAVCGLWATLPAWAGRTQDCDVPAVARALQKRLAITFPGEGQSGDVIDLTCQPHPDYKQLTIVVFFHDLKNDGGAEVVDQKGFVAAVVDTRRALIKQLYQETLQLNPGIRITDTSLSIDTARYDLAPDVRAFGVRMDIGHSPKCADGGTSRYLTVLVPDGKRLRAVLTRQPLRVWTVAKWNLTANIDACSIDTVNEADLTLTLGAGSSHGWRDLTVTARIQSRGPGQQGGGQRPPRNKTVTTLRYDGEHYPGNLGPMTSKLLRP